MLGQAPLSAAPLSAFVVSEPLVFAPTDIILRPILVGQDVCLWVPTEVDDCTPVVVPPTISWDGGGGNYGFMPWERKRGVPVEEDDDLELVQILTYWLNRL